MPTPYAWDYTSGPGDSSREMLETGEQLVGFAATLLRSLRMAWDAWVACVVFAGLSVVSTVANFQIARAQVRVRGDESRPSFIPFLGIIFAVIAVVTCPGKSPWSLLLVAVAVLLDPYGMLLILLPFSALREVKAPHPPRDLKDAFLRGFAHPPGGLKLGCAFVLWMALWIGAGNLMAEHYLGPFFGVITVVIWGLYIWLTVYSRKYR